jgi:hypothetical protein
LRPWRWWLSTGGSCCRSTGSITALVRTSRPTDRSALPHTQRCLPFCLRAAAQHMRRESIACRGTQQRRVMVVLVVLVVLVVVRRRMRTRIGDGDDTEYV